ncbi:MAG TPA: zinc-ribbon domain-containing protein [Alphaproteobacteria bacterium]|nr:zinc-ribbon domain-containing protein [Alphaproteobacteria bacterium]
MLCPTCGSQNPDGAKFCGECGASTAGHCRQCGHANLPQPKFCNECGAELTAGETI